MQKSEPGAAATVCTFIGIMVGWTVAGADAACRPDLLSCWKSVVVFFLVLAWCVFFGFLAELAE